MPNTRATVATTTVCVIDTRTHALAARAMRLSLAALDFADAVALVRFRAEAMQNAVAAGEGAMAAILGLDGEPLLAACAEAAQGQVLAPVNFNSPGQVVIAGHRAAVERGIEACKAKGAKRAIVHLYNATAPAWRRR